MKRPAESPMPAVRKVQALAPLRWLALGSEDFRRTGFRAATYGGLFALMGWLIELVYATRWQLTMGLTAGFFLIGPFVCAGIYELSRQRARGEPISLPASIVCWRRNTGGIAFFAAIVTFSMIIWARVSVVLFALFSTTDFPDLKGVVLQIVTLSNVEFILVWGGVGLAFAMLVFALSVVSVPLMLDRQTDTMMAIFSSVRALLANPAAMVLWALLIVLLIGGSLLISFALLIVTAPLVGHATWHAYQDLIGSRCTVENTCAL